MSQYVRKQSFAHRRVRGFTMIELMITVAVAMVLMMVALPSFRETAARTNVRELNNALIYALNLARAEAVRRGCAVAVVATAGSTSKAWSTGWSASIFDTGCGSSGQVGAVSPGAPAGGFSVCGLATGGVNHGQIVFSPSGTLSGATKFDINVNRPDGNKTLSQHLIVQGSGDVQSYTDTTSSPASSNSACT